MVYLIGPSMLRITNGLLHGTTKHRFRATPTWRASVWEYYGRVPDHPSPKLLQVEVSVEQTAADDRLEALTPSTEKVGLVVLPEGNLHPSVSCKSISHGWFRCPRKLSPPFPSKATTGQRQNWDQNWACFDIFFLSQITPNQRLHQGGTVASVDSTTTVCIWKWQGIFVGFLYWLLPL